MKLPIWNPHHTKIAEKEIAPLWLKAVVRSRDQGRTKDRKDCRIHETCHETESGEWECCMWWINIWHQVCSECWSGFRRKWAFSITLAAKVCVVLVWYWCWQWTRLSLIDHPRQWKKRNPFPTISADCGLPKTSCWTSPKASLIPNWFLSSEHLLWQ
jgi:hypothetical protein